MVAATAFDELKLTGRLPSPPGVGMAIIQLTETDDYDTADVARVIRSDPALAGRVLKLSNSVAHAGIAEITSIDEAVNRIGVREMRNVALGFSLIASYREGTCENFDFEEFWSESLARAIAAQAAARDSAVEPAAAYSCGLLAGIGKLALACVHPQHYSEVLGQTRHEGDARLRQLEKAAFEINHLEVAAALLEDWGLPERQITAITTAGRDLSCPLGEDEGVAALARVMDIASGLAMLLAHGSAESEEVRRRFELAQASLGFDDDDFIVFCEQVVEEWLEWGDILALPAKREFDLGKILASVNEEVEAWLPEQPDEASKLASHADPENRPLRVLACDDDRLSLQLLVRSLESFGYEVFVATDGVEALQVALETLPDVIVSDLQMPELNGIDLVRGLRRSEQGRQIYAIMLTGADGEEMALDAFEAGIDDYITKPFNTKLLRARVRAGERVVTLQRQAERDRQRLEEQMGEFAVLNRKFRQASLTDPLTDLPNRRHAMDTLQSHWSEFRRHEASVAAIMIDIDHFKLVNDRYGHDVGDEVLRRTAAVLKEGVREHEFVCRLGGEEFLVICQRATADDAERCAERLRTMIENNHIEFEGFDGAITISLGVAATRPKNESYESLLRAADEAVYTAKRSGRNRVCVVNSGVLV